MKPLFCLLLMCVLSGYTVADTLKPFTTDGCSSFPDGTVQEKTLWKSCCTAHDVSYWKGGTYQQRLEADNALKACVAKVGKPAVAEVMLAGVRVGGSPLWPTEFRWGYGWSYFRWYGELTVAEQGQVETLKP